MSLKSKLLYAAGGVAVWEAAWWLKRVHNRTVMYARALECAKALNRPLVVVGAPDRGATAGAGYGDLVIDIGPSGAPHFLQADVCKQLPLKSDCCVVYVSCVLEYVADDKAAMAELNRISGGRVFCVRVQPWTLTAYLYPGTQRRIADVPPPAFSVPPPYALLPQGTSQATLPAPGQS